MDVEERWVRELKMEKSQVLQKPPLFRSICLSPSFCQPWFEFHLSGCRHEYKFHATFFRPDKNPKDPNKRLKDKQKELELSTGWERMPQHRGAVSASCQTVPGSNPDGAAKSENGDGSQIEPIQHL